MTTLPPPPLPNHRFHVHLFQGISIFVEKNIYPIAFPRDCTFHRADRTALYLTGVSI
jgi:hypothetical protein